MDWENILAYVIKTVVEVVVAVLLPYGVYLLKNKIHNDKVNKYIDFANDVVVNCVNFVSQTFVDGLKEVGAFDKQKQIEAFERCKERVLFTLNDGAKKAVVEIFGDLDYWLESAIESSVRENKQSFIEDANVEVNEVNVDE